MKYIDLFAGIGGFHYGIDRVFDNRLNLRNGSQDLQKNMPDIEKQSFRATCVYSNEWDKYANSVYKKHFGECDQRDIREVDATELPDFDLLCGGFPCQSFSVAGKRGGFSDTRGTLFFEIARIAKQKQPRLLLLENVKGLLSHDKGNTFRTILRSLDELGYDCQWQVLNSKNFGVPQNRERVFIIGHLRGTSRPEVFPIRDNDEVYNQPDQNKEKIHNIASTMTARQFSSWNGNYIALTERRTEEAKRLRRLGVVKDTRNLKKLEPREDGIANTVTTSDVKNSSLTNGSQIRRLTPTECERLQGFPDNWTKYGANGEEISDTQRYKMMGNAVTTNVITAIVSKIIDTSNKTE
jgi:DNA (cytosine-5)-methyltransferase 1